MNIEIVLVVLTILVMISTAVTSYFRKKEFVLKDEQTATEFEKEMNEKKNFYKDATALIEKHRKRRQEIKEFGYAKSEVEKVAPILF